jgi:hypothetical protein
LSSLSEISAESVDSGFDKNESELSISILPVSFQMLSDRHGLLDQVIEIFGDLWCATLDIIKSHDITYFLTILLQDSQDLSTSQESDLGNTVLISQGNTNLTGSQTLREFQNQGLYKEKYLSWRALQ